MSWKSNKKGVPLCASRSTGDLLSSQKKTHGEVLSTRPRFNSTNEYPKDEVGQKGFKGGLLHVRTESGFWVQMWVVLKEYALELYENAFDDFPCKILSLDEARLELPETEEKKEMFYQLHIVKQDYPTTTFGAKSQKSQEEWADAIRGSLQTCSMELERLDLQCNYLKSSDNSIGERSTLLSKLDLVEELLTQRDDCCGGEDQRSRALCQKMVEADNWYDRIMISEQQDALRKATYLRQRKISTQLKADTIRKQLSKSVKEIRQQRPKSFQDNQEKLFEEEQSEFYAEQLQELTSKLKVIHSVLGKTEKQTEATNKKLGRKYENEMNRLRSDSGSSDPSQGGNQRDSLGRELSPTICVSKSNEDCRTLSQRNSITNSPKIRKKFSNGFGISSLSSLHKRKNKTRSVGDLPSDPNLDLLDGSAPFSMSRLSPLRLFGQFVGGKGYSAKTHAGRRNRREIESCGASQGASDDCLDSVAEGPSPASISSTNSRRSSEEEGSAIRTEIDPAALAEIEAFENLAYQFLNVTSLL